MKRKRYTEPQIVFALQQTEAGTTVGDICRKMAVASGIVMYANGSPRTMKYVNSVVVAISKGLKSRVTVLF